MTTLIEEISAVWFNPLIHSLIHSVYLSCLCVIYKLERLCVGGASLCVIYKLERLCVGGAGDDHVDRRDHCCLIQSVLWYTPSLIHSVYLSCLCVIYKLERLCVGGASLCVIYKLERLCVGGAGDDCVDRRDHCCLIQSVLWYTPSLIHYTNPVCVLFTNSNVCV